jgi:hypothetical protein|tara:strand:- start:162 stop:335 length:174 start_codon:yes stop_codon:yes gene_type:complete
MKKKITIEELKGIYGVTERTLNNWRRNKQLPIIEITPQQKWVYQEDLISWENSFIKC